MNELEKTAAQSEELSNATPAQQADENVENDVTRCDSELSPECDPELDGAVKETNEEGRNYRELDKQQLIGALRAIIEEGNMQGHKDVALIKQSFYLLRNKEIEEEQARFVEAGNDALAFAAMPDPDEAQFKELLAEFREKRNAFLEAEEERRKANLEQKKEIIAKLTSIVEDIDNVNLRYNEFQQLTADFKAIKEVPATAETEVWKTYQKIVEQFYDHLQMNKELRDLAFKKNLEAKQALIEEAKALTELDDVVDASRKLQDLHVRWKDVGPVDKSLRDEIWEEFRAASAAVNRRHQDFVMERKASESENEAAKTKLCETAEAICAEEPSGRAQWEAKSKELQELQAEWKKLGFASRKVNNQLYSRFRAACDDFFGRRNEFYKSSREELESNLAKKTSLCEQVEALRAEENVNMRQVLDKVQKLQAEWKSIGAVPRKVSDALWERFNGCCNFFYAERKKQNSEQRKTEAENLEKKYDIIARLKELPADIERSEAVARIKEFQEEWKQVGHVPMKMKDKVYEEFRAVIDGMFENFNSRESRNRMNNFEGHIQKMAGDNDRMMREEDRLQRQLEAKRNDLANYQNNLGFFTVKSSAGNSMVQELERKISHLKDEIAELMEKIKMLRTSKADSKPE